MSGRIKAARLIRARLICERLPPLFAEHELENRETPVVVFSTVHLQGDIYSRERKTLCPVSPPDSTFNFPGLHPSARILSA
jgi:hypothetical protein